MSEHKNAFVPWIALWLASVPMRKTMTLAACVDNISSTRIQKITCLSLNKFVSGPFSIKFVIFQWELVYLVMLEFGLHSIHLYAHKWKGDSKNLYSTA